MLISYKRGQGSIILRVKILDSSVTTGAGKTGLLFSSAGLIISTIADNEASATVYTQAAGNIETVATLGTYAAPTASKCRFKEVDATNHPGVVEIHLADARYAVASAKSLVVSISGAADAAETDATITLTDMDPYEATAWPTFDDQFNGTGVVGDTLPATQAQIGNISTGAGGLSALITAFAKNGAEPETNTFAATQQGDGTYHIVEDDGGNTDFYYQATVSAGGAATAFEWLGYIQSNGDSTTVWYWDWTAVAYKQITTLSGANGTTPIEKIFTVPTGATGTGADQGKVRLRFLSTSTTAIATDRLLCEFSQASQTVGYANGALWYNDSAANTNTTDYVDGTADNPVSTWAAILTLSASLKIKRVEVAAGSSITLSGNTDDYTLCGMHWTLVLNGQSISEASIRGAEVSGTFTAAGGLPHFVACEIGVMTAAACHFHACGLEGATITLADAGDYIWDQCYSGIAGAATPSVGFGAAVANTNLNMRHYSGSIEIKNMGQTGTDTMELEGHGPALILNANCDPSNTPTIKISGHFPLTDNVAGGFVAGGGVISQVARYDTVQITASAASALATYDPPTKAEMDSAHATTDGLIGGLNNLSSAQAQAACDASLVSYDPPTKAEMDGVHATTDGLIGALNDLSSVEAQAAAAAAIAAVFTFTGGDVHATLDSEVVSAVLTAAGLDNLALTPATNVPVTFREALVWLYRRWALKNVMDKSGDEAGDIESYADDGTTVLTTQAVTDDGDESVVGAVAAPA